MNKFYWFESKQLDRVTNFSTEIEPLKYAKYNNLIAYYLCTFKNKKKYFGLTDNIIYLGSFKNKYLKYFEFRIRVVFKSISIIITEKRSVIMVNQDLISYTIPAIFLNSVFKRNNKFITDIRTTPTNPKHFENDMKKFHSEFKIAVKKFDGFSFITPFMEKYIMNQYPIEQYKSVNWSSGVDVQLFNPTKNITSKSTPKTFQIFYHGGISISRGNLTLIKSVEYLVNEGYDIELKMVGICVDLEIKEYINSHNLQSWCKLMPPVPLKEIPEMIAHCDLPVLPFPNFMAWRVSSPIKLMEYLAMGKKVLAPDYEAFTDVFGDNPNLVYYYDSNDSDQVNSIKNGIQKIIDNNELTNGNFYPEARNFVKSNYTWEKQAEKLFRFCTSL